MVGAVNVVVNCSGFSSWGLLVISMLSNNFSGTALTYSVRRTSLLVIKGMIPLLSWT